MKESDRTWFQKFLDAFDTPGGHILICLCLLVGYSHYKGEGTTGHDIIIFAMGVLARSMGSAPSGAEKRLMEDTHLVANPPAIPLPDADAAIGVLKDQIAVGDKVTQAIKDVKQGV